MLTILNPEFWQMVDVRDVDECWPWLERTDKDGYGIDYGPTKAHRRAYELTKGPLGSLFSCHHCDNEPCCNPNHLFAGTPLDNMLDKKAKGRGYVPKGVLHHMTELTEQDVRDIRTKYASGNYWLRELGEEYNLSIGAVSLIVNRKTWKHLD